MTSAKGAAEPSLAEKELADARRDPRLAHGREAMIADWWAAMNAAERARRLGSWGLHELTGALEREEQRLGYHYGADDAPADVAAALQAAWERSEMARAEQENELVELNAMTLVAMVSAQDAMVELLVPEAQKMQVQLRAQELMDQAADREQEAFARVTEQQLHVIKEELAETLQEALPKIDRLLGVGSCRWERRLRHAGLQAPPDRPLPADLDEALKEIVALRHVIVHRAGRVGERALIDAPSLPQADGELVRLKRSDYRRYSAALWTYGEEVIRRLMRDLAKPVDLDDWRNNYTLG
jgi:hypothetical protein